MIVTINSSINKLDINFALLIPIALKTPISYFLSRIFNMLITDNIIAPTIKIMIKKVKEKLLIFFIGVSVAFTSSALSIIV